MINRLGVIFLTVCCAALVVVLVVVTKNATKQHEADIGNITSLSNSVVTTRLQLSNQQATNASLVKDFASKEKAYEEAVVTLTNKYITLGGELDRTEASLKTAKEIIAQRESKIADLEHQNQSLNDRADELSASITNLNSQIADTKQKLATSEGDKTFLQSELKRLMAEKADLEKQFNDLAVLREKVAKLRDEMTLSRRLDWIRRGVYTTSEQKGAERLMKANNEPTFSNSTNTSPSPKPNRYDLNVEVNSDGTLRVIPPPTNAAPKTP